MPSVHGFETFPQETPSWCWAAASQMMLRRYVGSEVRQCELASRLADLMDDVQVDCCKDKANPYCQQYGPLMAIGLRFDSTGLNHHMSWEQIKTEIDNNRPFVISSEIHYYICTGYEENSKQELLLWDPWPAGAGKAVTRTMEWYRNLNETQSYYNFRPA